MGPVHFTFGTADLERGMKFYDGITAEYGGSRAWQKDSAAAWSFPDGGPSLGICYPFDGQPATFGNGTMIATMVKDEGQVRRIHAAALANGGSCEGPPGLRENGMYAAYFRDPDGNKMNCFCVPGAS